MLTGGGGDGVGGGGGFGGGIPPYVDQSGDGMDGRGSGGGDAGGKLGGGVGFGGGAGGGGGHAAQVPSANVTLRPGKSGEQRPLHRPSRCSTDDASLPRQACT